MTTPKRLLTADELALVEAAWAAGQSEAMIAQAIGITIDSFRLRRKDQLRHLPVRSRALNSGKRSPDPTPDEIEFRAAMVRRSWSLERFLGFAEQAGDDPRRRDATASAAGRAFALRPVAAVRAAGRVSAARAARGPGRPQ